MKIDTKTFTDFINKACVGGSIVTLMLDFKEEGISCKVRSPDNVLLATTILESKHIAEYKSGDKLYIKDTREILTKLKLLSGNMSLTLQEGQICCSDENGLSFTDKLGSEEVIDNVLEDKVANELVQKFDGGCSIEKDKIAKITRAIDVMKAEKTEFVVENKKLSVINPNKLNEKATLVLSFDYKDVTAQFNSDFLKSVFNVLGDGKLGISIMRDDAPIMFKEKSEFIMFRCIIAPIKDDTEEDTKKDVVKEEEKKSEE